MEIYKGDYDLADKLYIARIISFALYSDVEDKWYKNSWLNENNFSDCCFLADKVEKFIGSEFDDVDKELQCCVYDYTFAHCDEWKHEVERGDWYK